MKKFFSFAIIGILTFSAVSCNRTSDVVQPVQDNNAYSKVYDYKVNMVKSSTDNSLYGYFATLPKALLNSDVLLIYRQNDVDNNGNPIWRLLPTSDFLAQGELNYRFDFTKNDFQIFADANFDLFAQNSTFKNQYLNNQVFRVVLVPADFGAKNTANDYSNYNEVIAKYHINDSNVKVFK